MSKQYEFTGTTRTIFPTLQDVDGLTVDVSPGDVVTLDVDPVGVTTLVLASKTAKPVKPAEPEPAAPSS